MDNIILFEKIPVILEEQILLDRMQVRKSKAFSKDFHWAVEQVRDSIHPRGLVGIATISYIDENVVKIGNQDFTSRILQVNLNSSEQVFPFLVTIGPKLETIASQQKSLLKKYFLETIGDFILQNATWYLERQIQERFSVKQISSMSPGSLEDWGMAQQVPLFNLFGSEATEKLGVQLSSNMVMNPRKSISGIAFHSKRAFVSCQLCSRNRCPGRRAPYTPEKFGEYGLSLPRETIK
ncbi:MAG: hypothetical protein JW776_05715 [Candidatus Lokiarchaeota archaeon]|nr:hypothetical protein [Candidatus Lokiarchaeota archaeon]